MNQDFDNKTVKLSLYGEKWLENKIQRMKNLLKIAEPDEALYREIMLSLGYPKNKVPFLELALMLPYIEVIKLYEEEIITKAMLFRAGLSEDKCNIPSNFDFSLRMDKSVWEYKGIRPANYPEKRIQGITKLLRESIETGLVNFFYEKIKSQTENHNTLSAVKKIMNFDRIGIQRKQEMFFNIIFPFFMFFSQEDKIKDFLKFLFGTHPPLQDNKMIKDFKEKYLVKISCVKEYMGAIYLMRSQE